jgi:hypothetical protein
MTKITESRDELIRAYISAHVWTFGVVSAIYVRDVFNELEADKTTPEELIFVGKKFAESGDVFSVRRELFVSAYAFDGWRFHEITDFAEKMPTERRKLSQNEILLYSDIGYEPTFPARERLRKFLEAEIGDAAPVCLNHMEKESRLGLFSPDTALENFIRYSGKRPKNRLKFEKLIADFDKNCTCWIVKPPSATADASALLPLKH